MPILDKCELEQNEGSVSWTPSKLIDRLGAEIADPASICYWAHRNKIPIFCPAFTDGSIGDMLYFHSYRNSGIKVDIVEVNFEILKIYKSFFSARNCYKIEYNRNCV